VSPAHALAYPIRQGAGRAWLAGVPLLLLFPVSFILVFGYALRATRAALHDPEAAPPPFRLSGRLLRDGVLSWLLVCALTLPFALLDWWASSVVLTLPVLPSGRDAFFDRAYALVAASFVLALPWGLVLLLLVPTNVAAYCVTGQARDLFDPLRAATRVRARFLDWNLASVALVTGWALGFAATGLLCVGFLPGAFYAILVSAYATASLAPRSPPAPAG
jgi:hypothetical protein